MPSLLETVAPLLLAVGALARTPGGLMVELGREAAGVVRFAHVVGENE